MGTWDEDDEDVEHDEASLFDARTAEQLKALGHPTRLRIVRALAKRPLSVTDLCEELDLNQSLVSWHLRVLTAAELIFPTQRKLFTVYLVSKSDLEQVIRHMRRLVESV